MKKTFSPADRTANRQRLQNQVFDLVIIGGGINGAGVARDACLRGMKVALIEARDFASGTSSKSSKLIHGGIRYLENYEFHLVFEALSERKKLLEMAPHLVHPLRFFIPLYQGGRVSMNLMGLGMWAYDALALFDAPESHDRWTPKESVELIPSLQEQGLLGGYTYSDAYMDDDRLVFETLRSANDCDLTAANYVKAVGCQQNDAGEVVAIRARDERNAEEFWIRGRHFLSTVGPWTDELGSSFFAEWKTKLRPTKGVHLTFSRERFPLPSAVVMAAEERIVFAIPRHEMVIVGTTDTDFKGQLNSIHAEPEDVTYLLGVIEKYFPGLKITAEDIIASYAGVRPLVHDGASTEGKTSREHTIVTDDHGITYVMGGKYTTYRQIAEDTMSEILKCFPISDRIKWGRCQTEQALNAKVTRDILDRKEYHAGELRKISGLSEAECLNLIERHGLEPFEMVKSFGRMKTAAEYEAAHAILATMCLNLSDFYFRRTPYFLAEKDHGVGTLSRVAAVFQSFLGWTDAQKTEQVDQLWQQINEELAWKKALTPGATQQKTS